MLQTLPQEIPANGFSWLLAVRYEAQTQTVVYPAMVLTKQEELRHTARLMAVTCYASVQRWYERFRTRLPASDEMRLGE